MKGERSMSVAMNEQETVIHFGRDSEECEIYTSDTTVMTKLDKLALQRTRKILANANFDAMMNY